MLERGHRATATVGSQAGDARALKQEVQQFGMGEDARDQLAVLEVVAGQGRLVLGEHAVDLGHALVRIVDRLALAEQALGDALQTERGEAPGRRTQRLDAVDEQPPCRRGEEVVAPLAVLAPLHLRPAAAQA